MHPSHSQPHYAPASVGGLMDPGFLRDAVLDADGIRPHFSGKARHSVTPRWYLAVAHFLRTRSVAQGDAQGSDD